MKMTHRSRLSALTAISTLLLLGSPRLWSAERPGDASSRETEGSAGLAVLQVERGTLAEQAGLQVGDLLLEGRHETGEIVPILIRLRTPFDLDELLTEWAPRGETWLLGWRNTELMSWPLPRGLGSAGFGARVVSASALRLAFQDGVSWTPLGFEETRRSMRSLRSLAERLRARGEIQNAAWAIGEAAFVAQLSGLESEETDSLALATTLLEPAGGGTRAAILFERLGEAHGLLARPALAEAKLRQALEIATTSGDPGLRRASLGVELADALRLQGRVLEAKAPLQEARMTLEARAPKSNVFVRALVATGEIATEEGRLDEAQHAFLQAISLADKTGALGPERSQAMARLGQIKHFQGNFEESEELFLRVIETELHRGYPTPELGFVYSCLAQLFRRSRDQAAASLAYNKSLRAYEALPGRELDRTIVATTVGESLAAEGDAKTAGTFLDRLLVELDDAPHDRAIQYGNMLGRLAGIAGILGRKILALSLAKSAFATLNSVSPNSPRVQGILELIGQLETETGHYDEARQSLLQAEKILQDTAADRSFLAEIWLLLGRLEGARRNSHGALQALERSLAYAELGSSRQMIAQSLDALGQHELLVGDLESAARDSCRAAEVAAQSRGEIDPQILAGIISSSLQANRNSCSESLLTLGRNDAAFASLERTRARVFLEDLSDKLATADRPPLALLQREQELSSAYDQTWARLRRLTQASGEQSPVPALLRLRELELQRREVVDEIRDASPRLATLRYPVPLDLRSTRAILDPGTVLLVYAISRGKAHLFVVASAEVSGHGLRVVQLAASEGPLRAEVARFRKLLADPRSSKVEIARLSGALYDRLLLPAESSFRGAKRLLIVADGPLHSLPFGALRRGAHYLVEDYPIHSVLSATLYGEIKKSRHPEKLGRASIVAFGDPRYPPAPEHLATNEEVPIRGILRGDSPFAPLPGSAREVEEIARIFPNSKVFLGNRATESEVRRVGPDVRILHFATHAILDDDRPMDSALALTIPEHPLPGQENGLLQAWEIFEQMRIDADLVTLSACNTALGKEMGGEGLVGLARAFQFAGARSVLASLWAIGDGSTSRFMPRFYEHLRDGLTKDEALRQTQIEWLRNPRTSHPYYWAAFQLIGDYR